MKKTLKLLFVDIVKKTNIYNFFKVHCYKDTTQNKWNVGFLYTSENEVLFLII